MLPAAAVAIALTVTAAPTQPAPQAPPRPADLAPEFRLKGDVVSIPFVMAPEDAAPFAKSIGVKSSRIMSLGYVLLKQYNTVWDYPNRMFYLLQR